jgi:hypothetical protein
MLTGAHRLTAGANVPAAKDRSHHLVESVIDTVVNLAKRRGLVYPAGEIYGGTKSAWDYGPLGVELKENIKRQWWRTVVTGRDDVVRGRSGSPPGTSRCSTTHWSSA